jgi:hypothetical protein
LLGFRNGHPTTNSQVRSQRILFGKSALVGSCERSIGENLWGFMPGGGWPRWRGSSPRISVGHMRVMIVGLRALPHSEDRKPSAPEGARDCSAIKRCTRAGLNSPSSSESLLPCIELFEDTNASLRRLYSQHSLHPLSAVVLAGPGCPVTETRPL